MIKVLEGLSSIYEPSKRSLHWLKVKKDYLEGAGQSFDLIVIGAFFERGKRTTVYGAYVLACYNTETGEYESICKLSTGFFI
jgi:DNA ligase-1